MLAHSRSWCVLLWFSAGDALVAGAWLLVRPVDLFIFLGVATPTDAILWRLLGLLNLGHGVCLILAVYRPGAFGGLVLAPLVGRLLEIGVWLWVLHSEPLAASPTALGWLIAHDAFLLPMWLGFLIGGAPQHAPQAHRG